MSSISLIQGRINKFKWEKEALESSIKEAKTESIVLVEEQKELEHCNKILSFISENNQDKIVKFFEYTISSGLKDMFNESYQFRFDLKTRGDSSSTDFEIHSSAFPGWSNIIMCRGKSVQEIISIIFRMILLKLDKKSRKILILDEPNSGVEKFRQSKLSKFLKEICDRFEIQLIVITHSEELGEWADKEIKLDEVRSSILSRNKK